ncbi:hypothetical protein DFH06DRAFT_1335574 [Mycena polygramma]|nr:hypothetical protein DFH06DRAFT_1335574 [Mycena polygramma]
MGWTTEELKPILKKHAASYFASKGDDRDDLVDTIVSELEKAKNGLPQPLAPKVKVWYNNNIALFREEQQMKQSPTKVQLKRWDAKLVAQEKYKERYSEIKSEISAAGTEWNELHRKTMAKLWNELDKKERTSCEDTAASRNSGEISEEEKRGLALANADKEVIAFIRKMHSVYGVRMLCLTSWTNPDGKAATSVHETTSVTPRFTQQFPRWKTMKGVVGAFIDYSALFEDPGAEGSSDEDEDEDKKNTNKSKYPWAVLGTIPQEELPDNVSEYPLLPEVPKSNGKEWIGGAKIMIRQFVKKVYELGTGSSTPPWGAMATVEGVQELVKEHFLPLGVALKDPSRMVKGEVEKIYKLWTQRQRQNKLPLRFKVAEAKQKIREDKEGRIQALKRKQPDYIDTSDNEDPAQSAAPSGRKKAKPSAASTSSQTTSLADKNKNGKHSSAAKPNKPAVASRPKPRPVLTPQLRKAKLYNLSSFGPYRSLVQELLRISVNDGPRSQRIAMPTWCSWDIDTDTIGLEFFDKENTDGYLPTWETVVAWMETNPHRPGNSELTKTQAFDILLIVGLTHRGGDKCATSEPGSELYDTLFERVDLDKIETAIQNMLADAKTSLKFGVPVGIHRAIEPNWKKVCLEVGLAEHDVKSFGPSWVAFVEAYVVLDSALVRSGKPPQVHATDFFPEVLGKWSRQVFLDGNFPVGDATDWEMEMQQVHDSMTAKVTAAQNAQNLDTILDEDWCRRGKGGIVCVVLGMKWWRMSLSDSADERQLGVWSAMLATMAAAFKIICQAQSIKRPESRR